MSKGIVLLCGLLAVSGCSSDLASGQPAHVLTAQTNYDHLGSCFFRQARAHGVTLETVDMERLTNPDEMIVGGTEHSITDTFRWWEADFISTGDNQTRIEVRGHFWGPHNVHRQEIEDSLGTCGVKLDLAS